MLGLLAMLWGASYPLIKVALETIPPVTLIALRVGIAAPALLLLLAAQGGVLPQDRRTWLGLLLLAVFNSIGAWSLLAWGQQFVDSALASILNSTAPVFVFLMTVLFLGGRGSPLKALGAALGIAGVACIAGPAALSGLGRDLVAQAAIVFGAFLYACAQIIVAAAVATGERSLKRRPYIAAHA
ncbi:MAG: DMT family transporter [Pseudomonadota bacterium]